MFDDENRKAVIRDMHQSIDDQVRRQRAEESSIETAELVKKLVDAANQAEQRAVDAERTSEDAMRISKRSNIIAIISIVISSLLAIISISMALI